jgi:hypothetical protein
LPIGRLSRGFGLDFKHFLIEKNSPFGYPLRSSSIFRNYVETFHLYRKEREMPK